MKYLALEEWTANKVVFENTANRAIKSNLLGFMKLFSSNPCLGFLTAKMKGFASKLLPNT
jgi:hypothetical protein